VQILTWHTYLNTKP